MNARLSVGDYASRPYCFEGLNLRVFCVEELCYALKENAFLLDTDIMSDSLIHWLEQECALKELADSLYMMVHKKGSLSAFVSRILEYTGFYDMDTIRSVEQTLKKGAGLNILEKRKLRIDQLVEQKKYRVAAAEYDALLSAWEESENNGQMTGIPLYCSLLHNKGTALAGLMCYGEASEAYRKAYETDGNQESLRCFLAAKRMELSDEEYVEFIAGLPQCYKVSLALEKDVERWNAQWEQGTDYGMLMQRTALREEDERSYLEENRRTLEALKEGYRGC